jgi:anti-anti-sigma factor
MADSSDARRDLVLVAAKGAPEIGDPELIASHFEGMSSALWMVAGPEYQVVAANRAARTGFGHDISPVGRPGAEVFPELVRQDLLTLCDQVYAGGTPLFNRDWPAGGSTRVGGVDQELTASASVLPTRDPGGAVVGLLVRVTVRDADTVGRDSDAAVAVLGQRYRDAREVVVALQRSLLPAVLPVLPDVRLAARYLVASREQAAGGDWFDALPVGSDLALVVGDVVGHGAAASGAMGQLRAVLMEFLLEGMDLAEALARLDRFAVRVPGGRGAAVCVARLDRSTQVLSYASCGQLPPLVISVSGDVRALPTRSGGLLGVDSSAPFIERVQLVPGDVVVLYSDGLVERPGHTLQSGIDALSALVSWAMTSDGGAEAGTSAADRICARVDEYLAGAGSPDDVTVLVAEVGRSTPAPLVVEVLAAPSVLAELRHRLTVWLGEIGTESGDALALQVATSEALANVVEHAYPDGGGMVRLEALIDSDGRVCVTVADHGRWRPPSTNTEVRELGLDRMRSCMDSVELDHCETGTTVLMERQLSRPVIISEYRGDTSRWSPSTPEIAVTPSRRGDGAPIVTVVGPVDIATVDDFKRAMRDAGQGGVLPLTIDLTGVTILASAGVHALHEQCEEAMSSGQRLRVVAPPRSPSRDVLRFSGLADLVDVLDIEDVGR